MILFGKIITMVKMGFIHSLQEGFTWQAPRGFQDS